ncbi:MAG TPA: sigma-70 family RNA polymerase sigma factor [Opitutaceae bacterium]|nr:sigma-70 family RNA polymerase sigma factor [Opitutaceae bacterium]
MIAAVTHDFARLNPPVVADDDESFLIARARDGDVRAFEALYRRHVPRVFAVCLRLAADPVRAEELTQSAFVQLWQKLPLFRGESAFSTWLHRLAVNTALMDFRATRRRTARVVGVEDPAALETPPAPPEPGLRADLEQAIAGLPAQARAVFVLHDVEGYTHDEVARLMDLEVGTTKSQLHRARQLLREALR